MQQVQLFGFFLTQGAFLAINSDEDTIARNTGFFIAVLQCAGIFGNTFSYFQFKDSYEIAESTKNIFITGIIIVTCIGVALNLLVIPMTWAKDGEYHNFKCKLED